MFARTRLMRASWVLVIALLIVAVAALREDAGAGAASAASFQVTQRSRPLPVRNDVPRQGREILVLRNHELRKGGHERFYQFSRDGLWPYFERIGARIVGQWKVIQPQSPASSDREDVYRLVRYASFEHWQATRSDRMNQLGGDGPAWETGQQGLQDRRGLQLGSKGAYFLEGRLAPGGPYFMPGLAEQYERVQSGQRLPSTDREIPVRADVPQPGDEIVELRYQRIAKGAYERFVETTQASIWPWEEKLGARPIGQWLVIYPAAANGTPFPGLGFITAPNAGYDEVITMTKYASRSHLDALAPDTGVYMGGNGPDWVAWRSALEVQRKLTTLMRVEIIQGFLYQNPPMYLPGLPEQYRRTK